MTATDGDVLLTGATGFVGMELLARYLERASAASSTLVRASDDDAAARADRRRAGRTCSAPAAARYARGSSAVAAELTAPGLGLGRRARASSWPSG